MSEAFRWGFSGALGVVTALALLALVRELFDLAQGKLRMRRLRRESVEFAKREAEEHLKGIRINDFLYRFRDEPVGTLAADPDGVVWLRTDNGSTRAEGQDYSVASYPEMFAAFGYTFGRRAMGVGEDNFRVPDLRGKTLPKEGE